MTASERNCVFCAIGRDEAEATRVLERDDRIAFLDRRPLFPGHALLVPRAHQETLLDLPPEAAGPLLRDVQLLARAVERALDADGSFIAVNNRVSQSVPHLHVHVVPRRRGDGLRGFFWPRQQYDSDAHRAEVGERIRAEVARLDADAGTAAGRGGPRT